MNDIEASIVTDEVPVHDEKEILRQSIERSEADLREAVEDLTTAVKNDITLGAYIVDRPTTWLAGGLAVGLLLALRR